MGTITTVVPVLYGVLQPVRPVSKTALKVAGQNSIFDAVKGVLIVPLLFLGLLIQGGSSHAVNENSRSDRAAHCRAWKNTFLGRPSGQQQAGLARFMEDENFALLGGRYDSTIHRPFVFGRKKSMEAFYFRADDGTKITGWVHMLRQLPAKRLLHIKGLLPGTEYMVKWYDTATGEPAGMSQKTTAGKNGELAADWPLALQQKSAHGDGAFKIVRFSR